MTNTSVFTKTAKRLCRIRTANSRDDDPFVLDDDGFLSPYVAYSPRIQAPEGYGPGSLIDPSEVADRGALVLLGEPGAGKTTVFQEVTNGLPRCVTASPDPSGCLWVNAADLVDGTFEDLLGVYLRQLPERRNDAVEERQSDLIRLTVVLDQLDESQMRRRFAGAIARILETRDTRALRLLIGCRTSDYPEELTDVMTTQFGRCFLADLAPLTREQAVELADSADVNGQAVVDSAVALGAGALASTPLTLDLLVRTVQQYSLSQGSAQELFAHGVRFLLETDEDDALNSSLDQRLAVAKRMAARLVLSGRRSIWTGPAHLAGELDMHTGGIAGGTERISSGLFDVSQPIVNELLQTPLFLGRGNSRLRFRHSSIAAYLAACYLAERDTPSAQLSALFLVPEGNDAAIVPSPLREVAAWLVAFRPNDTEWIVGADPSSLAAHSQLVDSDQLRYLIVDALLRRSGEVELSDEHWQQSRWQLEHPQFVGQMLEVLNAAPDSEPTDWDERSRITVALRLVRANPHEEFVEPLLKLVESDQWSPYIRQFSARAAYSASEEIAVPRLIAVLDRFRDPVYGAEHDEDDEVLGVLLELLWPSHISIESVLPLLRLRRNRKGLSLAPHGKWSLKPMLRQSMTYRKILSRQ
jgi:hypothetical protein